MGRLLPRGGEDFLSDSIPSRSHHESLHWTGSQPAPPLPSPRGGRARSTCSERPATET
jgi:hypothetical protein